MSESTERAYKLALHHFETEWGGTLPADSNDIARYLTEQAKAFSPSSLRIHLAALTRWHVERGIPSPTKAPIVRHTIRDITDRHPPRITLTPPLQLTHLEQIVRYLDETADDARESGDRAIYLRHVRNKAMVLVGFWFGFTAEAICCLEICHMQADPENGLICSLPKNNSALPHSEAQRAVPALNRLCPLKAYLHWTACAGLSDGAVFRGIDSGGKISTRHMNVQSITPLLGEVFTKAGIRNAKQYKSRSFQFGFANWASLNGWDTKSLKEYVGWKHEGTAIRHAAKAAPFTLCADKPDFPSNV
jgi:integrase